MRDLEQTQLVSTVGYQVLERGQRMCPACIGSAALIMAGTGSASGVMLAISRVVKRNSPSRSADVDEKSLSDSVHARKRKDEEWQHQS